MYSYILFVFLQHMWHCILSSSATINCIFCYILSNSVIETWEMCWFGLDGFILSLRCHLPMLYIGLEYGLTNNSKLAERFFSQALSIAPEDPFVIHEVAVVAFQNGEWVLQPQTHRNTIAVLTLLPVQSDGGVSICKETFRLTGAACLEIWTAYTSHV